MTAVVVRAGRSAGVLPAGLAAAAVLAEVAYPLVHGAARDRLTVATVLLFAGACVTHAGQARGPRWAAVFAAVTVSVSLLAEALGVRTGLPFGSYRYGTSLGPAVLGVPLVVPLAWVMVAYPSLVVGRRLGRGARGVAAGAVSMAGWDLFLDPQLVAGGHWRWSGPAPWLNGIPLLNTVGWLAVSAVLLTLLARLLPDDGPVNEAVPLLLWWWTLVGSVVADLFFFGRPGVALAGGLVMGALGVMLVRP